jgi:hypothetical protein
MLTKSITNAILVTGFLRLNKPRYLTLTYRRLMLSSLFALLFFGLFAYVILDIIKNIIQNYKGDK